MDESCGYRPAPNYNYKSDAATMDEKDNVRLYIQPAPPPDCKVSTVIKYVFYVFQLCPVCMASVEELLLYLCQF